MSAVKKSSKPSDDVVVGSSRSAATASVAKDSRDEERPVKRRKIGSAVDAEDRGSNSTSKGKQREIVDQGHSGPVIKVSDLVANPSLMLSLSIQQREALRQAAEQKWLTRHPSFEPETQGGIGEPRKPASATHTGPSGDLQALAAKVESGRNEVHDPAQDNQPEASEPSEATKQALAEKGGLVVPVWKTYVRWPISADSRLLLLCKGYCRIRGG